VGLVAFVSTRLQNAEGSNVTVEEVWHNVCPFNKSEAEMCFFDGTGGVSPTDYIYNKKRVIYKTNKKEKQRCVDLRKFRLM
jgi:hypothetical protein